MLAARKKELTTARARKNKHTARMLENAHKSHSIGWESEASFLNQSQNKVNKTECNLKLLLTFNWKWLKFIVKLWLLST